MSAVFFDGNTYIFGATVSANPGTGTTSELPDDIKSMIENGLEMDANSQVDKPIIDNL